MDIDLTKVCTLFKISTVPVKKIDRGGFLTMLNWDDFENLRVVKRLKSIVNAWWNAEVVFADDKGHIRNVDRDKLPIFKNKLFNMIIKSPRGLDIIEDYCRKSTASGKITKKTLKRWDETGLPTIIVPIYLDDNFAGCVLATSFFTEETTEKDKEKLYKMMRDLGYRIGTFQRVN